MDNASGLPARGHTWFEGQTPPTTYGGTQHLEGQQVRFRDFDSTTGTDSSLAVRTGRFTTCRFVRNTANITLEAKRIVSYEAGHLYKRVNGYCTTTAQHCAGIVDEYLATGIPDNDLGWIVTSGPALVKTSLAGNAENVISADDVLVALTAATSQATTSGRLQSADGTWSAAQTTDGGAFNEIFNYIGRAITARTTANTNTDTLINVEIVQVDR